MAAAHLSVQKIKGAQNPADILTKAASRATLERHRKMLGQRGVEAHSSQRERERELRLQSLDRESGQPELGKTGADNSEDGVGFTRKVGMKTTSDNVRSGVAEWQTAMRRRPRLMSTISSNSASQGISSKTGVQQGGLQFRR